jgi:flagellar biosynthesis protein FlhF
MEVHTFRAASLQEALQQVRDSLGPDASVLQTRELRSSLLSIFARKVIEVEATADMPATSRLLSQLTVKPPVNRSSRGDVTTGADPASTLAKLEEPARQRLTQTLVKHDPAAGSITTTSASMQAGVQLAMREENDPPSVRSAMPAGRQTGAFSTHQMPPMLFELYGELLDNGVEPQLSRSLMQEIYDQCTTEQAGDAWYIRGRLSQLIAKSLVVSGSLEMVPGQQQIVALVGPTGVGKTTTLAKIAAGFRFDMGCQIGLITLDTFRLGAVDQLLQYAELISAPLEVVSSPDQVASALQRLKGCDLVLIDTAGRSPRDAEQLSILRDFLNCAQPQATHLVVSGASSPAHVQEAIRQYSIVKPTGLIITKLDETVGFGSWLSLLQNTTIPVSYLTTGQHVPQDIVVASSRRLASLVLGQNSTHEASATDVRTRAS